MSLFIISENMSGRMAQMKALSMESKITCITDCVVILHAVSASTLIAWL